MPKPFSGRELLARVRANLELAQVRREAGAAVRTERRQLEQTIQQLPVDVILAQAPSGRLVMANDRIEAILGHQMRRRREPRTGRRLSSLHAGRRAAAAAALAAGARDPRRRDHPRRGHAV
ncbi:MAG: hypothetical protein ACRDNS_04885 [Trebonia sp.]